MTQGDDSYIKGELVPAKGTYRCTECGELWIVEEMGVRFPPCDASKTGRARWIRVEDHVDIRHEA